MQCVLLKKCNLLSLFYYQWQLYEAENIVNRYSQINNACDQTPNWSSLKTKDPSNIGLLVCKFIYYLQTENASASTNYNELRLRILHPDRLWALAPYRRRQLLLQYKKLF